MFGESDNCAVLSLGYFNSSNNSRQLAPELFVIGRILSNIRSLSSSYLIHDLNLELVCLTLHII